jgi:hypothetical protein
MGRNTSRKASSAVRAGRKRPDPFFLTPTPQSGSAAESRATTEPVRDALAVVEESAQPVDRPPVSQAPDLDEVEEDMLPGVEYNVVLTAPPREIIPCLGQVVSIVRGREDLPMSDEDWQSILIGDDED